MVAAKMQIKIFHETYVGGCEEPQVETIQMMLLIAQSMVKYIAIKFKLFEKLDKKITTKGYVAFKHAQKMSKHMI